MKITICYPYVHITEGVHIYAFHAEYADDLQSPESIARNVREEISRLQARAQQEFKRADFLERALLEFLHTNNQKQNTK